MTDNSNSTGSSGSSTNSWTILSPEEATVENIGPVDDGTESLGDVPSLSEEVAGSTVESKPSEIQVETILSEEGHEVCQETSPETSVPPSPGRSSPLLAGPLDSDPESQAPVIHDIVTSSPGDNEHLGAMPFVTNIDPGAPLDIPDVPEFSPAETEPEPPPPPPEFEVPVPAEPRLDAPADLGPMTESPGVESPVPSAEPEASIPVESLTATEPFSDFDAGVSASQESPEAVSQIPESLAAECLSDVPPETIASAEATDEPAAEKEETELPEKVTHVEREEAPVKSGLDTSSDDDGLRRRHVPPSEAPRRLRTSDEEDEEELEFRLAGRKEEEESRGFSLNKIIVAAIVLLCLGSLFLSDDDSSELSDEEQNQDWLNGNPQDMKELLDKLAQENQQISQLEVQLRSQKDELDSALEAAVTTGNNEARGNVEKENAEMKEELSSLPGLKEELDTLRARVTELSQLTAPQTRPTPTPQSAPHPAGKPGEHNQTAAGPERRRDPRVLKEELQRQKVLLEGSRTRLEGMKRGGGGRKGVRDGLEEIQRRLSEQVEQLGMKKPWEAKRGGNRGKESGREQWKREEKKKDWRGEKDWRSHGKEGGWKDKDERREKDWKSHGKHSSHKESWRKYQDEWERKKDERRTDRETRRKDKPWHHTRYHRHQPHQPNQHHHQPHQPIQHHHQPPQYNHDDFWRQQAEKLQRSIRPQVGCSGVEDCAAKEGLYPVELSEFEELLEGYLSKLEGSSTESKDQVRKLTAGFFEGGAFVHDRVIFSEFAEDVADILEDMADVLEDEGQEDDDALEEEMEEFEREALWKFAATA